MNMNEKFRLMARPPQEALRTIDFGKLKNKTDINPQWRIEALTEVFGLCGVGWYYEILAVDYQEVAATGERMVYITIAIHVKQEDGTWSAPIIGIGGDFVIIKDKNGIHGNDEALQMALTDALGKAAKCVGIANDIYRGKYDSKYGWRDERAKREQEQTQKPYFRIINKNAEIMAGNGIYYPISRFSVAQLNTALDDPKYEEIKYLIQTEIDKRGETK